VGSSAPSASLRREHGVQEVMLETLALSIELGKATLTRIGVDEAVRRDATAAIRQ
jgi:hypothetical protein